MQSYIAQNETKSRIVTPEKMEARWGPLTYFLWVWSLCSLKLELFLINDHEMGKNI